MISKLSEVILYFIPIFHTLMESNSHFTLTVNSDTCEGFISTDKS
jgi:hypothetical protein